VWNKHAAPGSNKIFNVALRRKCLPNPWFKRCTFQTSTFVKAFLAFLQLVLHLASTSIQRHSEHIVFLKRSSINNVSHSPSCTATNASWNYQHLSRKLFQLQRDLTLTNWSVMYRMLANAKRGQLSVSSNCIFIKYKRDCCTLCESWTLSMSSCLNDDTTNWVTVHLSITPTWGDQLTLCCTVPY